MQKPTYKPASECSQAELIAWRRLRVSVAALGGGAAALAVLIVLGLVAQFPSWPVVGLVCTICAAATGFAVRLFTQIPSPIMQKAMQEIRHAGGWPAGDRMIETWK